jgi:hypothetical protein
MDELCKSVRFSIVAGGAVAEVFETTEAAFDTWKPGAKNIERQNLERAAYAVAALSDDRESYLVASRQPCLA